MLEVPFMIELNVGGGPKRELGDGGLRNELTSMLLVVFLVYL